MDAVKPRQWPSQARALWSPPQPHCCLEQSSPFSFLQQLRPVGSYCVSQLICCPANRMWFLCTSNHWSCHLILFLSTWPPQNKGTSPAAFNNVLITQVAAGAHRGRLSCVHHHLTHRLMNNSLVFSQLLSKSQSYFLHSWALAVDMYSTRSSALFDIIQ